MTAAKHAPTFDTDRLQQARSHWLTQRFSDPELEAVFLRSYSRRSWLTCL